MVVSCNSLKINDSNIEVETKDNNDNANSHFTGIYAISTIINNSKVRMKSNYELNSMGVDACFEFKLFNSEFYIDTYKGMYLYNVKKENFIQQIVEQKGLDNLESVIKVDNSIVEINSKTEPITCTSYDDAKTIVPIIVHENYNNYKILVGESKTNINDWDNESLLTNYRYLKIFDLVETNNEIKNKEDSNISIENNLEEIIPLTEQEQKMLDYGYEIEARIDMEETTSVVEEVKNKILEKVDKKSKIASYINIDLVITTSLLHDIAKMVKSIEQQAKEEGEKKAKIEGAKRFLSMGLSARLVVASSVCGGYL